MTGTRTTRRPRRPRPRTWLRDTASYLGGWGLIVHQVGFVPRGDFNLWPLLLGGLMIGVPGLSQITPHLGQIVRLWLTGGSPSPSPEEESSPPLPSSSPPGSEADR